ncbi:MAG: C10 family peptidase, partial [FCB group bacterium]|nr:C10 family peptidase [FCB group bacterium]
MQRSQNKIIILLLFFSVLIAAPVGMETAMLVARRVYPEKIVSDFRTVSDHVYLSIFEDGGFLLISADNRFPALLGYSEHALTEYEHPAFQDRLLAYGREMGRVLPKLRETHPSWDLYLDPRFSKPAVRGEVQPLITSTWNQSPYYNDLFPKFSGTDTKAYAGCVAVVMGQLIRYYEHPSRGIGRKSYYDAGNDSLLVAWFDTTVYRWENMPASLNAGSTRSQITEISRLLYQSAVSVEMEFKTDGSYASYDDMLYAMTGY